MNQAELERNVTSLIKASIKHNSSMSDWRISIKLTHIYMTVLMYYYDGCERKDSMHYKVYLNTSTEKEFDELIDIIESLD